MFKVKKKYRKHVKRMGGLLALILLLAIGWWFINDLANNYDWNAGNWTYESWMEVNK